LVFRVARQWHGRSSRAPQPALPVVGFLRSVSLADAARRRGFFNSE
jgi:hypothetical protein